MDLKNLMPRKVGASRNRNFVFRISGASETFEANAKVEQENFEMKLLYSDSLRNHKQLLHP